MPMFLIVIDLFVFKLAVGNVTVIVELLLSFKYITLYEVKSSTNDTLVPVLDIYKLALALAVADNVPLVKDKPLPTVTPTTCPVLLLPITLVAVPDTDDKVTVPLNVLFPVNVSLHDLHAAPKLFLASASFAPPVPPFKTGKGTPLSDTAKVPFVDIGLPDTDKKVGTVIPILVTLPVPAPMAVLVSAPSKRVIVLLELTFINLSETLFVKVKSDIPLVVPPNVILAFA